MSIGYMPKKLKNARRQRRMRKKYKNFSCTTCAYNHWCRKRIGRTPAGVVITKGSLEFCPDWLASDEAKKGHRVTTSPDKPKNKRTLKEILRDIF